MRISVAAAVLATVILLPGTAVAAGTLVDSRSETVTGADLAARLVGSIEHVYLGSTGATVTIDTALGPHDTGIEYSDMVDGTAGNAGGALGLSALIAAVAALFRGAATLLRVFRG